MKYFWYILLILNFSSFILNEDLFLKGLSLACSVLSIMAILLDDEDISEQ